MQSREIEGLSTQRTEAALLDTQGRPRGKILLIYFTFPFSDLFNPRNKSPEITFNFYHRVRAGAKLSPRADTLELYYSTKGLGSLHSQRPTLNLGLSCLLLPYPSAATLAASFLF